MKTAIDMTDAEDLASEKRDVIKAIANLRTQRHQYRAKKYKNSGGISRGKCQNTLVDILKVLLVAAISGLVVFYILTYKHETSGTVYIVHPDTGNVELESPILPQTLPPTGAN